jgi:hypothetical protein
VEIERHVSNINHNDWPYLLILILIAVVIRSIPELLAYPYPLGYDVINYYVPVITNFGLHWNVVSNQFPLYVSTLHFLHTVLNLDSQTIVVFAAIGLFAAFSTSVYAISRKVLQLSNHYSLFLSIFVILQISVLRTSWDLHKDILALTSMFFALSFIGAKRNISIKSFVIVLILCTLSVLTDRMIGLLLTVSLIIYALIRRNRKNLVLALVTSVLAIFVFLQGITEIQRSVHLLIDGTNSSNPTYAPLNLLILFVVLNIIIIPIGIIGFKNTRQIVLKIPLLLSLVGSLLWIAFPYSSNTLPDRWTFIFSILLSVFAGYGIIVISERRAMPKIVLNTILIPFFILGMLFALSPNDPAFTTFSPFHEYIGQFTAMTMQYNSVSIPQSKSIINALEWINHNTPIDSNVVIDKNWRGWAELQLNHRSFNFYEQASTAKQENSYVLGYSGRSLPDYFQSTIQLVYDNDDFSVYKLIPGR